MGRAKDIKLKVIPAKIANDFVKKHHYSGKVVPNSQLHFGAFLNGILHGVMSYGKSMDVRKTISLVKNTKWNEFLELNRMAFDNKLPKNSESRCIATSIKLIKKNAPHIKWIISFADATQCGDGARIASLPLTNGGDPGSRIKTAKKYGARITSKASMQPFREIGAKPADGYMMRYIYLINKSCEINTSIIPYSKINEMDIGMYKGKKKQSASKV